MTDPAWIDGALTAARPQAVGALLRYFRDLDTAEEAFQDACLRALKSWPQNGPPRDPAAWLIMVGRNAAIDEVRRSRRQEPLPEDEAISDLDDAEDAAGRAARRLALPRRHAAPAVHLLPSRPAGDAADRAGAAHRLRPDGEADRARLPGQRGGDGAAHHPRQGPHRRRPTCRSRPRARSSAPSGSRAVAAMIYLVFNEGYSAGGDTADIRAPLCEEAIRLARLLLRLFQAEPEIMGLTALMLLQHARAPARFDADGEIVLLDDQDRSLWNQQLIAEGLALIDKAMRHRRSRALSGPGRDRGAACPRRPARRHRLGPDRSALRRAGKHAAVAGGDAQPRGRGVEGARARGGAGDDRAAGVRGCRVISITSACAALS